MSRDGRSSMNDEGKRQLNPALQRLAKAFALSVAYGANIGGVATLTGSPPNLVFKQQTDK